MIGWMQNRDTCSIEAPNTLWFGQMSLPGELHVREGRLYQTPVRELEQLRRNQVVYRDVRIGDKTGDKVTLSGVNGRRGDMELTIRPEEGQDSYHEFILNFAENDKFHTSLIYQPASPLWQMATCAWISQSMNWQTDDRERQAGYCSLRFKTSCGAL